MNITRNGKIARLPQHIRELLNRRLRDGEQGKTLATLLNGLPEVRAVMAREFGGRPIREQNVSEWKQGGYREWLAQQEALEMAGRFREEAGELRGSGGENGGGLMEDLAVWIAARLMAAVRAQPGEGDRPDFRMLRQVCGDVVALRKGDHQAERLRMEKERVAIEWERLTHDGTRVLLAEKDFLGRFEKRITTGLETLMRFCKKDPKAKAAMDALVDACGGIFHDREMNKPEAKPAKKPQP